MTHPLVSTGDQQSFIVDNKDTLWKTGIDEIRFVKIPNTPVGILFVTCSSGHCILIDHYCRCWSFGMNYCGQLGLGHVIDQDSPTQIEGLDIPVRQVSCGNGFTMCVDFEGNLWSFGDDQYGQLGIGDSQKEYQCSPQKIKEIPPVKSVSCGGGHAVILDQEGFVWSVGWNGSGELGIGNRFSQNKPIKINNLTSISEISSGSDHTMALDSDGQVWSFGYNYYGQLGHGSSMEQTPGRIPDIPSMKAICCREFIHH